MAMKEYLKDMFVLNLSSTCEWVPANQFLFQFANLFLMLTYIVRPGGGLAGRIQVRAALTCAGLCYGLWGGTVVCSLDCMLWNLAFAIGNACHLVYLLSKVWPTSFGRKTDGLLYENVFKSVGLRRYQFRALMKAAKEVRFQAGEFYARQGFTESSHLSILAEGCFEVMAHGKSISHVDTFEFLDSPEWLTMSPKRSSKFQVSIVAVEDSLIYQFDYRKLCKIFKSDDLLKNVFDAIVGRDIAKKMFSVHRTLLMANDSKEAGESRQVSLLIYSAGSVNSTRHFQQDHKNNDQQKPHQKVSIRDSKTSFHLLPSSNVATTVSQRQQQSEYLNHNYHQQTPPFPIPNHFPTDEDETNQNIQKNTMTNTSTITNSLVTDTSQTTSSDQESGYIEMNEIINGCFLDSSGDSATIPSSTSIRSVRDPGVETKQQLQQQQQQQQQQQIEVEEEDFTMVNGTDRQRLIVDNLKETDL